MLDCPKCYAELPLGVEACPSCGRSAGGAARALAKAISAFAGERYEDALVEFERAREIAPNDLDVQLCHAHGLRHAGQGEAALPVYRSLIEKDPENIEARFGMGSILMEQGRLSHARSIFEDLVKQQIPFTMGQFYWGMIFPDADQFLAECCYLLAIVCWNRAEMQATEHYFQRALEHSPDHGPTSRHLGNLYFQNKDYTQAIRVYERFVELRDEDGRDAEEVVEAYCNLGIAYYETAQLPQAIGCFNKVLGDRPGHSRAIYHMNLIYEREGEYAKSETSDPPRVEASEGASMIFGLSASGTRGGPYAEEGRPIIGKSVAMQRVLRLARLAAASTANVLLTGENGTGKELIARSIQRHSDRCDGPFCPINCAAIPENLIESELFGHEKGAFTGAIERKLGRFEAADKGTIFLDEIGELDRNMQVKMLRVLQEREFTRVGGNDIIRVDVRIIAATNHDLEKLIEEGLFRQDLFFRLNVLPIQIPPLRVRTEDIPLLVEYFLHKYSKGTVSTQSLIKQEDLDLMMQYDWPGNIRELENIIERAMVLGTQVFPIIQGIAKNRRLRESGAAGAASNGEPRFATARAAQTDTATLTRTAIGDESDSESTGEPISIRELERRHILKTLRYTSGNRTEAARLLQINPSTLWRKIKSYDLEEYSK